MHIFLDNKPTFSQFTPAALTCLFIIKKIQLDKFIIHNI